MEIKVRGRLGGDPEVKESKNGTLYATFSLAHTPRKKVNGDWVDDETQWYRVVMFDKKAKSASYCKKGDDVLVFGTVKMNTYTNKDGQEKTQMEITGSDIYKVVKEVDVPVSKEGWDNPW